MEKPNKCFDHEIEIKNIRTEFTQYKETTNRKLDEILEGLKPQFTTLHITSFLFSVLVVIVSIILYIETIKSDNRINQSEIRSLQKISDVNDLRYDLILEKLNNIDKKVDVNAVKLDKQEMQLDKVNK